MINKKWDELLKDEFKKPYFKKLGIFVKNEYNFAYLANINSHLDNNIY